MTSVILIAMSFLIDTKDKNLSTRPDELLSHFFVIMLISSSQILCENTICYEMPVMDYTFS